MYKMNDSDILNKKHSDLQIPSGYFEGMEDRVLHNYRRKQSARRIRILSVVSGVLIVLSAGMFYINSDIRQMRPQKGEVALLKDTVRQQRELLRMNKAENTAQEVATDTKNQMVGHSEYATEKHKNSHNHEVRFSEEELSYLENYLNEDNYELVYNALMK